MIASIDLLPFGLAFTVHELRARWSGNHAFLAALKVAKQAVVTCLRRMQLRSERGARGTPSDMDSHNAEDMKGKGTVVHLCEFGGGAGSSAFSSVVINDQLETG
jgi:hypothetical protein